VNPIAGSMNQTEPVAVVLDLIPRGRFADLRFGALWYEGDVSHGVSRLKLDGAGASHRRFRQSR